MEDLACSICNIAEEREFACSIQARIINNMRIFNNLKECNCCHEHSLRKPVDIADRRRGQRFPYGDTRNYTGTHEDVAHDERIDTIADKYPRVMVFKHPHRCTCTCRTIMRAIADDVSTDMFCHMQCNESPHPDSRCVLCDVTPSVLGRRIKIDVSTCRMDTA